MARETSDAAEFLSWLLAVVRSAQSSELLTTLLSDARLQLGARGRARTPDEVDEVLARLAVLAKARATPICLVLPDADQTRPAGMLATLLLDYWWDRRQAGGRSNQPILYLGNDVGIREDLANATVRHLGAQLSETLAQTHLARGSRAGLGGRNTVRRLGLPSLVTAYAPADPADLVRRYSPPLVVVDLGTNPNVPWLDQLVSETVARNIPTVIWATNPLPGRRPLGGAQPLVLALPRLAERRDKSVRRFATTEIRPLILGGDAVGAIGRSLRRAVGALSSISPRQARDGGAGETGVVVGDAVALHWRLLRALELMPCPLDFHEALARNYWGLTSLADLDAACERFRNAAQSSSPDAVQALSEAAAAMDDAATLMSSSSPMWDALAQLAVEGDGNGLDLVFGTRARRNLFLDAMLSIYGISIEDLRTLGVDVLSLAEIEGRPPGEWGSQDRRAIVAGSFAGPNDRYLQSLLGRSSIQVLIHPHELRRLHSTVMAWASRRAFDLDAFAHLLPLQGPPAPVVPPRVQVWDPTVLVTTTTEAGDGSASAWPEVDTEGELARFLELVDFAQDLDAPEDDAWVADDEEGGQGDRAGVVSDMALRVTFADGWTATYAPDDRLMFLRGLGRRVRTESRPASDLRPGSEIVAIHGQRRQSLYGLLVERLHRNPVIALQLALIREWQRELAAKYRIWSVATGKSLDELVLALRARGSRITSAVAVRFWVDAKTLAPQDPDDIQRIAEVLSMEFTLRRHREIAAAAARLRGLHRGVSNRITNWLDREAGGVAREEDRPIDPALGLQFSDFASTLIRLTVLTVEPRKGPFLRSRLGLVERDR